MQDAKPRRDLCPNQIKQNLREDPSQTFCSESKHKQTVSTRMVNDWYWYEKLKEHARSQEDPHQMIIAFEINVKHCHSTPDDHCV
jgi:hypothetical protein